MSKVLNSLKASTGYFLDDIFAFISAPKCPGCDIYLENPRIPVCPICEDKLSYPGDGPVCLLCRSPKSITCSCSENKSYKIPKLFFWAPYTDLVRALIHQFKFERRPEIGNYLTSFAMNKLKDRVMCSNYDLVIPIPMLKRDKRKRTFNQTELMAEVIANELNCPVECRLLIKSKPTRLQADLGREERWLNIKDAFKVDQPGILKDQSILLVDDIVTTGATTIEASKALYKAGAERTTVFSIASSH